MSPIHIRLRKPESQFTEASLKTSVCGQKPSELQNLPSDKTTARSVYSVRLFGEELTNPNNTLEYILDSKDLV